MGNQLGRGSRMVLNSSRIVNSIATVASIGFAAYEIVKEFKETRKSKKQKQLTIKNNV
jgi:hypothetical protein